MPAFQFFDFLIIGNIQTDYIIDLQDCAHNEILGGSALYAAGGLRCWEERIAVASQVNDKYSHEFQKIHKKYQISFEGVKFQYEPIEDRHFFGYLSPHEVITKNPTAYYASKNLRFPKSLIGFTGNDTDSQRQKRTKYLPDDIPLKCRDATTALLCSDNYMTQLQLSALLLNTSVNTLVIHSDPHYMNLESYEGLPYLLKDVNSFITTTHQLDNLFRNRSSEIWERAEILCGFGCQHLVMYDGKFGYYLYESSTNNHYQIPIYPNKMVDPTGMQDSFNGGYLAGLKKNFDPVEGLVYGSVSASLTAEGSGPFYCADTVAGLQQHRLELARKMVKKL